MLREVVTGGQTGVDQAAWRAAVAAGLRTGGRIPRGFLTEDGPRPDLASRFGAEPMDSDLIDDRTRANVALADATLVFADDGSGAGTHLTVECCRASGKPFLIISPDDCGDPALPARVTSWVAEHTIEVLNIAGDRESTRPGIGARVEQMLTEAFVADRTSAQGRLGSTH